MPYKKNAPECYTPRIDGFQIRDCVYFGGNLGKLPVRFDIVKWVQTEPQKVRDLQTGEMKISTEYCYSVGFLKWDEEDGFSLESVGLRWLEANPPVEFINAVLAFAEQKARELMEDRETNTDDI